MRGNTAKLSLLGAMGIFGTVGIFVRHIPLSSAAVAFSRGLMGSVFLVLLILAMGKKPDVPAVKKNLVRLLVSGAAIGFNWIFLFEAYRYTTVATATVCYYLAPVFLILASPLLGEKMTGKKLLCAGLALAGMVFVSGVLRAGLPQPGELMGIGMGVAAALLYATAMLLNKTMTPIGAYDKTVVQLSSATAVILPYLLLTEGLDFSAMDVTGWWMLAVVGIVHTGIAYALYFGAIRDLRAQTVAVFSYLDPVIAILLSALLLREPLDVYGVVGAVLILGSALYSELPEGQPKGKNGEK